MQVDERKKELAEALGRVVKKLRQNANLSARSIACGMNMSKTTLLLAEQGKLDPQMSTFCKLAEAFYLKPEEMISLVMKELPEQWSLAE